MQLETLTQSIIPAIQKEKENFTIRFKPNSTGKSTRVKIITLENQMLIKLKVEISYDKYVIEYGIKTKEIKKLDLYDSLGYKISLRKEEENILKNVTHNYILADI